jgi:hypothetical protein
MVDKVCILASFSITDGGAMVAHILRPFRLLHRKRRQLPWDDNNNKQHFQKLSA